MRGGGGSEGRYPAGPRVAARLSGCGSGRMAFPRRGRRQQREVFAGGGRQGLGRRRRLIHDRRRLRHGGRGWRQIVGVTVRPVSVEGEGLLGKLPEASCFRYIAATKPKALVGASILVHSPFAAQFIHDRAAVKDSNNTIIFTRSGPQIQLSWANGLVSVIDERGTDPDRRIAVARRFWPIVQAHPPCGCPN